MTPGIGVLGPLSRLHQAQKKPAAKVLALGRQVAVDLVRPMIEHPFDAPFLTLFVLPQLDVPLEREPADLALLPGLGEGELQQRQRPGCPSTSASSRSISGGSTSQPTRNAGRSIASRSSGVVIGPTSSWSALSTAETWGNGAGAEEVRPHRQNHHHPAFRRGRRIQEIGEEVVPVLLEPRPGCPAVGR